MTTNEHHEHWKTEQTQEALDGLLGAVRRQAMRQANIARRSDAEDIAQDASLAIHLNMAKYDSNRGSFSSWVWLNTKGIILDRYEQEKRRPVEQMEEGSEQPTGEMPILHYARLAEAFAKEPQLLKLIMEGHSFSECEKCLGITRKALRFRLVKLKRSAQQGPK